MLSSAPWAKKLEKQGEELRLTPLPTNYRVFIPVQAHTEAEPVVRDSTLSNKHLQLQIILLQLYIHTAEALASSVLNVDPKNGSQLV